MVGFFLSEVFALEDDNTSKDEMRKKFDIINTLALTPPTMKTSWNDK